MDKFNIKNNVKPNHKNKLKNDKNKNDKNKNDIQKNKNSKEKENKRYDITKQRRNERDKKYII